MYDRNNGVDLRLLGCALVLLVMALLTIRSGLAKQAAAAAANAAPAAVLSAQESAPAEADEDVLLYAHL